MSISHPSMRRAKIESAPTQEHKTYVVDNPLSEPAPVQSLPPQPPTQTMSPKLLDTLESLLFLGRLSEKVDLGGTVFEISTLTQKENAELVKYLYKLENGADLFAIRVVTLSYAIKSINNVPLEDYLPDDGHEKSLMDKKIDLLNSMQKHVVEKLHEAYLKLSESSNELFSEKSNVGEELKK